MAKATTTTIEAPLSEAVLAQARSELARRAGLKGGAAYAKKVPSRDRKRHASNAARTRWEAYRIQQALAPAKARKRRSPRKPKAA